MESTVIALDSSPVSLLPEILRILLHWVVVVAVDVAAAVVDAAVAKTMMSIRKHVAVVTMTMIQEANPMIFPLPLNLHIL